MVNDKTEEVKKRKRKEKGERRKEKLEDIDRDNKRQREEKEGAEHQGQVIPEEELRLWWRVSW